MCHTPQFGGCGSSPRLSQNFPGLLGKKQIHLGGGSLSAGIQVLRWESLVSIFITKRKKRFLFFIEKHKKTFLLFIDKRKIAHVEEPQMKLHGGAWVGRQYWCAVQ